MDVPPESHCREAQKAHMQLATPLGNANTCNSRWFGGAQLNFRGGPAAGRPVGAVAPPLPLLPRTQDEEAGVQVRLLRTGCEHLQFHLRRQLCVHMGRGSLCSPPWRGTGLWCALVRSAGWNILFSAGRGQPCSIGCPEPLQRAFLAS